jgi:hypothetical protein
MNPLFIHDWAERNPDRRWPCVGVLLLIAILVGCSLEPLDEEADEPLTRDEVKALCRQAKGADATLIETSEGHLICRRGRSA